MHHPTDRIIHTTAFVTPVVGALAGTRNSSMGPPPWRIDPMTHRTMSERYYHEATSRSLEREIAQWEYPMKDRSDDPSHHERTLLPRSYVSLLVCALRLLYENQFDALSCLWHVKNGHGSILWLFTDTLLNGMPLPYFWRHTTVNKMCRVRR